MDIVIKQGKAFYWGTSEWSAAEIMAADGIARQYGLTPPSMEQPQYNMLWRGPLPSGNTRRCTATWATAPPSGARWRPAC